MLSLLVGLLRLCASLGVFPGCWRLHREARNHRFVVAKGHALLVSLRRVYSPDAHLLLEKEAAFDDEHLFDNRNHDGVALFPNGGHSVDLPVYRGSIDFHRCMCEQLVDQLLPLMGDPSDLDAPRFHSPFGDRDLFSEKRDDAFAGFCGSAVGIRPRSHGRSQPYRATQTRLSPPAPTRLRTTSCPPDSAG